MMSHSKKAAGFSLIELMVVMAIMAVLMGLTGGLLTRNVAQQQRVVELEKIQHLFKLLSYRAYYEGQPIHVEAKDNELLIKYINQPEKLLTFKELNFRQTMFEISTRSTITPDTFYVSWNNIEHEQKISGMFLPYEAK